MSPPPPQTKPKLFAYADPAGRKDNVDEALCKYAASQTDENIAKIDMKKRCLSARLKEHATQGNNSAIEKHFL